MRTTLLFATVTAFLVGAGLAMRLADASQRGLSGQGYEHPLLAGGVWTVSAKEACHRPLHPRPSQGEWMALKYHAMTLQGLNWHQRDGYTLEWLIPRELGGSTDVRNMFAEPTGEARRKQALEAKMAAEFCRHDHTDEGLVTLQRWFADLKWMPQVKP